MFSWLAAKAIAFQTRRIDREDGRPTLVLGASDLTLPVAPDEVIASGWPWRSTVCIRGTDHLRGPDGTVVYDNRYVIWGRLRWGRLRDCEVYDDTEKAAALDAWISLHRPEMTGGVRAPIA